MSENGSDAMWKTRHPKEFGIMRNPGGFSVSALPLASADSKESTLYVNKSPNDLVVHVSYIEGDDTRDGLTRETSVKTLNRAFEVIRLHGYNETATVKMASGYFNIKDTVVSFNTGDLGHQRCPVVIEGVKLEKVGTLFFTPTLDQGDKGEITRLWTLQYPTDNFDLWIGDIIVNLAEENQSMQVVNSEKLGPITYARVSWAGEMTQQRFNGAVYRFVATSTNICASGVVEFIGKADRVYFKNIRFILDEGAYLKFFNLLQWLTSVTFTTKKGRNSTVIFDTVKKLVIGERVAREFRGNDSRELTGAFFESLTSNLNIILSNTTLLGENIGMMDASLMLRDSSTAILQQSYFVTTSQKNSCYVYDLSSIHTTQTRFMNIVADAIVYDSDGSYIDTAFYRS